MCSAARAFDFFSDLADEPTQLKDVVPETTENLADVVSDAATNVTDVVSDTANDIGSLVGEAASSLGNIVGDAASGIGNIVGGAASGIGNIVGGAASGIGSLVGGAASGLGNLVGDAAEALATTDLKDVIPENTESTTDLVPSEISPPVDDYLDDDGFSSFREFLESTPCWKRRMAQEALLNEYEVESPAESMSPILRVQFFADFAKQAVHVAKQNYLYAVIFLFFVINILLFINFYNLGKRKGYYLAKKQKKEQMLEQNLEQNPEQNAQQNTQPNPQANTQPNPQANTQPNPQPNPQQNTQQNTQTNPQHKQLQEKPKDK
ncbi:skeleton-binding protein 1 [Plasmodium reichenowi]|uniref:Skeleton-binding protein 1 n=1 Tax=Plasmodium reichenowi TaxID=5854 RepID=A0A060RTT3_PLARE|nr:skeleton-binding protein 1 [Plasmodium reichenowi]